MVLTFARVHSCPNSVGALWPFLSDPERLMQQALDIQDYTDPDTTAGTGAPIR